MSLAIGALAASGGVALVASYVAYRYLTKLQEEEGLRAGEPETAKDPDGPASFAAEKGGSLPDDGLEQKAEEARRFMAFGRDITGIIRAAENSPMNDEVLRAYREHMKQYSRTFGGGGKITIPFECLIPLTHSLRPIVNERGEVLVKCFQDRELNTAPVIDEGTPERAETENLTAAEKRQKELAAEKDADFVQTVLDEKKETPGERKPPKGKTDESDAPSTTPNEKKPREAEKPPKEKTAAKHKESTRKENEPKAKKAKPVREAGAKKEEKAKPDAESRSATVDLLGAIESEGEPFGGLFDALEEEEKAMGKEKPAPAPAANVPGDDEKAPDDADCPADGETSEGSEGAESVETEAEVPVPVLAPSTNYEPGDYSVPRHLPLGDCPDGDDLGEAVEKRIAEDWEAKRAVVHNLAFHRHIILYNNSYFLIEQRFLADAVVETFRDCFTKGPNRIKTFKREYEVLERIAEEIVSDPEIQDAGWSRMRMACVSVDGDVYRGRFLRTGPGLIEKYLGASMLTKMYDAPHIRADYIDTPECQQAKQLHKVF